MVEWEVAEGQGEKNDNHRHFNNMQRYSRLPRRASVATMALYNDKDTPGRLGTFRSTKGAALGSSRRTGTCFVQRGQMSPIMSSGTSGDPSRSQNNCWNGKYCRCFNSTLGIRNVVKTRVKWLIDRFVKCYQEFCVNQERVLQILDRENVFLLR